MPIMADLVRVIREMIRIRRARARRREESRLSVGSEVHPVIGSQIQYRNRIRE